MKRILLIGLLLMLGIHTWADNTLPSPPSSGGQQQSETVVNRARPDDSVSHAQPSAQEPPPSTSDATTPKFVPANSSDLAAWVSAIATAASLVVAAIVMYFTKSLKTSTVLLWEEAKRAGDTAKDSARATEKAADAAVKSADAAVTAANAALAALDRPWLFVEQLQQEKGTWISSERPITVNFRIANYGNAPAFVNRVRVAFFRSLDPGFTQAPSDNVLSTDFIKFPNEQELSMFPEKYGQPIREPDQSGMDLFEVKFGLGMAIASMAKSEIYYSHGMRAVENNQTHISIEKYCQTYLIGIIGYTAPNGENGYIRFCYEIDEKGHFREKYGAPYNERKTLPLIEN